MKKAFVSHTACPNKVGIIVAQIVVSLSFLSLVYRELCNYQSSALKFAAIDFIARAGLGWMYNLLIFMQIFLGLGIFYSTRAKFRWIYEAIFLIYIAAVVAYLAYVRMFIECIECNFNVSYVQEGFISTIGILTTTLAIYYLIQFAQFRRNRCKSAFHTTVNKAI